MLSHLKRGEERLFAVSSDRGNMGNTLTKMPSLSAVIDFVCNPPTNAPAEATGNTGVPKDMREVCDAPDLIPDDIFYVNFDCTNPMPKNNWQCLPSRGTFKAKVS